jgi:hypothetical protein
MKPQEGIFWAFRCSGESKRWDYAIAPARGSMCGSWPPNRMAASSELRMRNLCDRADAIIPEWPTPRPSRCVRRFCGDLSTKTSPRRSVAKAFTSGTPLAKSISISPAPPRSTSSDTACPKFPRPSQNRQQSSSSSTPACSPPRWPNSTPKNCSRSPENIFATEPSTSPAAAPSRLRPR